MFLRRVLAASVEDLRQQTELIEGGTEEGVDQYKMTQKKKEQIKTETLKQPNGKANKEIRKWREFRKTEWKKKEKIKMKMCKEYTNKQKTNKQAKK